MTEFDDVTEEVAVAVAPLPPEANAFLSPTKIDRVVVDLAWARNAARCWPRGRRYNDYRRQFESERRSRVNELAELLAVVELPDGLRHGEVKGRIKALLWELRRARTAYEYWRRQHQQLVEAAEQVIESDDLVTLTVDGHQYQCVSSSALAALRAALPNVDEENGG